MEENALMEWPHLQQVLARFGTELIENYRLELAAHNRAASGKLANDLNYEVVMGDQVFAVDLHLMKYWQWVEEGSAPHWPPRSAIRQWIDVKPVIPRPMANGKLPSPDQLAFLISRKIAQVGTEGTHDLRTSVNDLMDRMTESIAQAVTEDMEQQVDIILSVMGETR